MKAVPSCRFCHRGTYFSSVRLDWSRCLHHALLMFGPLDELLPVYVVFRTPILEDDTLKSYLARLVVNIEAFAFSTAPPPEGETKTAAPKEVIYSSTIKESDEPTILRHGSDDEGYNYIIWRV